MNKSSFLQLTYCHLLFIAENLFYGRRVCRTDTSSTFSEYLYKTILLFYHYSKNCLIIKDEKRKFIRFIVGKYCSIPSYSIKFVSNYGLNTKSIAQAKTPNALCFGLHDNCEYEQALCEIFNIKTIACDPTPISQETFRSTDKYCFNYLPFAIATKTGDIDFYLKDNSNCSGGSIIKNDEDNYNKITVQGFTYGDLLSYLNLSYVDILKMDIDGGEQEILLDLIDSDPEVSLPTQIALEIDVDLEPKKISKLIAFLDKMKSIYKIYFIPHKVRYSSLELLLVIR